MGYETVHRKLFRAPRQAKVTPQVVARRVLRLLSTNYPQARAAARDIAKSRREISWRALDRLGEQIEKESPGLGMGPPREVADLVEALLWRGWPFSDDVNTAPSRRMLCDYCHRPAVGVTKGQRQIANVCAHHVARSSDAQRAARLTRWAGGLIALQDKVAAEAQRLRVKSTDQELEAVLAATTIDPVTRAWWKRRPDLELAIRIAAYQTVEAEYRQWVAEARMEGGRRGGAKGGRPQATDRKRMARARNLMSDGASLRGAAQAVGMSPATLSRRLRDPVQ